MNVSMVFETIKKGLEVVSALTAAEKKIEPAIKVIYDLATSAADGKVTDAQLNAAEEQLDAMIDDFNTPLE